MASSTKVVPVDENKICRPMALEVFVFDPESGYRFKINVECTCTPEADATWKLVFDLYKVADSTETQLVHVSFTAGTPVHAKGVQTIAGQGINQDQADVLVQKVHPVAKAVADAHAATPQQRNDLNEGMAEVVDIALSG